MKCIHSDFMVDYIVMYSGGLTSFEAARLTIEKYGKSNVRLWFADTLTEDEDLYRFNKDVENYLGVEIEVISEGESVWDIFFKHRFLGNTRADPCSKFLKRNSIKKKLKEEYPDPKDAIVVLGMDDIEDCNRWERAAKAQEPYETYFPLIEQGPILKSEIINFLEGVDIDAPRLYSMGFTHNNCGGFCVKAGLGQFAHLYETMPERYLYHENKEQEFREFIEKDVSILRDRRGGETSPLTMKDLRQRIEDGEKFNYDAGWTCMCFVDTNDFSWL
ncbi:MAG: phosphoadenosine phosphosulfate reductase domain-containing protein [Planctomycetota bacterium]|jgi:hypothetical protein